MNDISGPLAKICASVSEAISLSIQEGVDFALESPIERVFALAICAYYRYLNSSQENLLRIYPQEVFDIRCSELERSALDNCVEYPILACSQYQLEGMRVDFCFAHRNWRSGRVFRLIVECDGHDFHERTKEQAAKDRSRDRSLQEKGHNIFRFTGSELWRNPMGCAEQVADWLSNKSGEKP